ncbi:reverse transcriptase, partial [Lasius niger]
MGAGLLLLSEPAPIMSSENWYVSRDKKAAIYCYFDFLGLRCCLAMRGDRFVATHCGPYLVISTYISPNIGMREYNSYLDELSDALSSRVDKIILAGDFNAKASLWGSQVTNGKGLLLTRWAAKRDLRIVNIGHRPTCVRPQGSSIIDLTWASPDLLSRIEDWRVREEMESLSDYLFISFEIRTGRPRLPPVGSSQRRWNWKKFDRDFFRAVMIWKGCEEPRVEDYQDPRQLLEWLDRVMVEACDAAAPRIGPRRPRRHAYWWQDSVAMLRHQCIRARRLWQRAKRRRRPTAKIDELGTRYKLNRRELRIEIGKLKSIAWQELIDSINKDPWGLPYKLVLGKLRPASVGMTATLDPGVLFDLLNSLFPRNGLPDPVNDWSDFVWSDDWSVSLPEVTQVIRRISASLTKAPGPDGFRLVIWKRATEEILEWVTYLFNVCLKSGDFPREWKIANLVLIPKDNKPAATGLPKARPICLINEIGKIFERVLADRIADWQFVHPESDFSGNQFGFRKNRSTCDALLLREITSSAVGNGGFAVVVSLDIRNAFNSIPWRIIRRALKRKEFPQYIRRILDSYLSDRTIAFTDMNGEQRIKRMETGVPQGFVLGPVLWNIAYDSVLDFANESENCSILCYADDTLIVVTDRNRKFLCTKAGILVASIIRKINKLGLSVAREKTEAILFHGKNSDPENLPRFIMVGDTPINFVPSIKYLGAYIDVSWTFSDHFRYIEDKTNRVIRALNRLMPNLRGPDERRRRLFANVIMSVMLYGA